MIPQASHQLKKKRPSQTRSLKPNASKPQVDTEKAFEKKRTTGLMGWEESVNYLPTQAMARTKQTAQLTTGGSHPSQQLKTKNKYTMKTPKQAAGGCALHANLIVEDVDVGMDISNDAEAGSHPFSPLTLLPPSSPVQSLPVWVLRSMQDEEMWDEEMHNEAFTRLNETQDPVLPTYPVLSSHFTMSSLSQVNGMESQGTPLEAVATFLRPYFHGTDLQYIKQEFDFGTQTKYWTHQIRAIPTGQVLFFISTHSEQQRGNLFAGQEGSAKNLKPVAVEVNKFFRMLLAGNFASLLNGATLVLLTCGWLVQHAESFCQL
ncbi:hypothetical protein PAXINDRAFT_155325 [Paxillus involutus ATCC 200175]|uniref:Uncharacterized protein n=1 Tax=Paxillus involutus ATCC 200175 TaxID=664439 RepID=A0A0C9T005_PAXIN|nr:hypothetical protein PAXINDRAFT_155325 [Paxillus involutus ATCC 200175]